MGSVTPGQVVLGYKRKQAGQAMEEQASKQQFLVVSASAPASWLLTCLASCLPALVMDCGRDS